MLAVAAVCLVALLHLGFFVLEALLWRRPVGRRIFGTTAEFAEQSAALAVNQGLYNTFLAAGLLWGAALGSAQIETFFLICVVVAGVVGALTVSRRILIVQALPAGVALALVWAAH